MLTKEALLLAFRRIDDFWNLNEDKSDDDLLNAVFLLEEAVGLNHDLREIFVKEIADLVGHGKEAEALLGFIVGCFTVYES